MAASNSPRYEIGDGITKLRHHIELLYQDQPDLHLDVFFEHIDAFSLGPAWTRPIPDVVECNLLAATWITSNPYMTRTSLCPQGWSHVTLGFLTPSSEEYGQWIDDLKPIQETKWQSNGIHDLIMLSKQGITLNLELLSATMVFWDNTTYTFNFRMNPMSPTILDMTQFFGLRLSGKCVDIIKDWAAPRETNKKKKGNVGAIIPLMKMNSDPAELKASSTSFSGFLHYFKGRSSSNSFRANPYQEHIHFLLYWLNKFLFPNPSKCIKLEWIPLAEALNAYDDVAMGPFVLSHLYSMLDKMTRDRSFQTNQQGPLGMVQIWLQWYFPELRSPKIVFEDRTVPAIQLALAPLTHRTTLECLYMFREYRARTTEKWDASFFRAYPWFEKGNFLEELDGLDDKWGTVRFFSCVQVQDIAWGVRSEYPYNHGMTVCSVRTTAIGWPLRRPLVTTTPDDRACGGAYPPPPASRRFLSRTPFSLSRILSFTAKVFVNRGPYISFWANYWA